VSRSPDSSPTQLVGRWPWQRSFQARIILSFGGIFLIILTLLTYWIGRSVYTTYLSAAEHDLEIAAFLASNALEDPLSGFASEFERYQRWERERSSIKSDDDKEETNHDDAEEDAEDGVHPRPLPTSPSPVVGIVLPRLQAVAKLYASDSGARVTILDIQGNALADSKHPIAAIANQAERPEVISALAAQERSDIRPDDFSAVTSLFAAAPIQQGTTVLGVVQLSKPMNAVTAGVRSLLMGVATAAVIALLLFGVLAAWLARRLVRPVREMEIAAHAAATGDLSRQVPVQTSDELGALAGAFNHMINEVRTMLEQQRAFVANASHELRTPLTNIKLRIEAVRSLGTENPALSARYLDEVESETDRMSRMASVLLDLTHLETRPARQPLAPVDVAPALAAVAEMMRLRAEQAGLTLRVLLPDSLPHVMVQADELEEVVFNLLDNSVKYAPAGAFVTLSACRHEDILQIVVEDTGPGIPLEDQPHIFDRFYRVDKVRSRKRGDASVGSGAGLGLSITKLLVEQNGGRITLTSAVGQGTRFVIVFPLAH
jgi:signal transduction histidine kinase